MFLELLIGSAIIAALSPNAKSKPKCKYCDGTGYTEEEQRSRNKYGEWRTYYSNVRCSDCKGSGVDRS